MLYEEERKTKIVEYIQQNYRASVQELSENFEVSESTIRRDLSELEDAKLLKRTHGGAVCLENVNFEPSFLEKEDKLSNEKSVIAKKAAEFIQDGDTILLDAGTTTLYLAEELKNFNKLTVVTNSLIVAQKLQDNSQLEVVITGGTLRHNTLALVGPVCEKSLSMLRVDKGFIATNGVDIKEGLTTPNIIEASTKRKMIEISKQSILLADYTKIGRVSFAQFGEITAIDKCIMDEHVHKSIVKAIEEKGVNVYIAK